jgi:hypothetical protein
MFGNYISNAGANFVQSSSQKSRDFARILPKQEVPSTRL